LSDREAVRVLHGRSLRDGVSLSDEVIGARAPVTLR
jgi:hypothetical protein